MTRTRLAFSILGLLLPACGSPPPAALPTPSASVAEVAPKPEPQAEHFRTAGGEIAFVLDRTGPTAKLRLDGKDAVVELTSKEDTRGAAPHGSFLVSPDGKPRIFVAASGQLFMAPSFEVEVVSDHPAARLPAATVTAAPATPP